MPTPSPEKLAAVRRMAREGTPEQRRRAMLYLKMRERQGAKVKP